MKCIFSVMRQRSDLGGAIEITVVFVFVFKTRDLLLVSVAARDVTPGYLSVNSPELI